MHYLKFESWAITWGVFLGIMMSYIVPVAPFVGLSVLLILCDWYTGVKAARKANKVIHNEGFARSLDKMLVYLMLILCADGIRVVFFEGFRDGYVPFMADFPITYIAAFSICIREFKSITENAYVITGVDVWKVVAERIETMFSLMNKKKSDEPEGDQ